MVQGDTLGLITCGESSVQMNSYLNNHAGKLQFHPFKNLWGKNQLIQNVRLTEPIEIAGTFL